MKCQACKVRPIEVIEKCNDEFQPYEVCQECHKRLLSYSLRPVEWYNLASMHTCSKFLLHDDFYDDNGVAGLFEDVENPEEYPAPSLHSTEDDVEQLLDYCIAKWWLKEDMINSLKKHKPQELLDSIQRRFAQSNNYHVKDRLYEIASKSLGYYCETWIRERWQQFNGDHLIVLSEAASLCLPFEEGYNLVKNALEDIPENELPRTAFACLYSFRTPLTIDWIETKVKTPVKDSWGRLAAVSNPTWDKLSEWIRKGRPYSLVAIDTLYSLIPHPGNLILKKLNPRPVLLNPATTEKMTQMLIEYLNKDKVARVRQRTEAILKKWSAILDD